jgi:hypothetical protein
VLAVGTAAHAGEQTITIRDWTGRGFAPEVIGYDVPAEEAEKLRVAGPDGVPLPVQVVPGATRDRAVFLFPADLPKDATVVYKVSTAGAAGPPEAGIKTEGQSLVLSNSLLAVRAPKAQQRTGVAVKDLPPPILAFQSAGGPWRGAGRMLGEGQVASFRVLQTAAGPVRAEVRYEIDYPGGGTYRCMVRVDAREPVAEVIEEYDLKGAPQDSGWELDLAAGWQPQQAEWIRAIGNGSYGVETKPLAEFASRKATTGGGGYGTGGTSKELGTAAGARRHVCRLLAPDSNWSGDQAQYVGLSAEKTLAGVVLLHKGTWRRPNNLPVWSGRASLAVQFPIGCRPLSWLAEITSESSPFSMHEHDPRLPETLGRRVWGLQLAPVVREPTGTQHGDGAFFRGRVFYGLLGLDRYKDLVLLWEDAKVSYPRVFLRPDEVQRMRNQWQNSPVKEGLAKFYMVTGDVSQAKTELAELKKRLPAALSYILTTPAMGHHHNYHWLWVMAEDVLSWPELPAEDKQMLRARLALAAYLYADGDVTSKGSGTHHGNPNMGVARQLDGPLLAALLADHPLHNAWCDYWAAWCDYKFGQMTSAGGAWFEQGSAYQMHAFNKVNRVMAAWEAVKPEKLDLFRKRLAATWRSTLDQATPVDPRAGARLFMGIHNSPPGFIHEALETVGAFAPSNPGLAANLKWLWLASGADNKGLREDFHTIYDRPWIAPKEPAMASQVYPGLGVVFRAHQGAEESWMFLRGGYHWSHAYPDQGNFNFMSRGSVLVPWQPYQYYWAEYKDFSLYNTVRLGDPRNEQPFAWPDQNVMEHAFTTATDYARVSIGYPSWYIRPAVRPGFGDPLPLAPGVPQEPDAVRHDRQVVFVKGRTPKGPTYAVFRDTFRGPGQLASWLNLNLLGRKTDVRADGARVAVSTEFPMQLDLHFLGTPQPSPDMEEDDLFMVLTAPYGGMRPIQRLMAGKKPGPNWVRKDGKRADYENSLPDSERHVVLRVARRPGEEYHWVLFPRAKDGPPPQVEQPAPGVVKVTHAEGSDWIFCGPDRIEWSNGVVAFKGTAGAVRLAKDGSVGLQLLAGAGEISYRGAGVRGTAPLERTIAGSSLKPGIEEVRPARDFAVSAQVLQPGQADEEYIAADPSNRYTKGAVKITGGRGTVRVHDGGKIRFATPDTTYVEMTCGKVGIRGMGPFDLTYSPDRWSGTVDGIRRTLVMTPAVDLVRPMLLLDGQVWASGIADEPSPWRGAKEPQFGFAAGVESGKQDFKVVEWQWPALPPAPTRAALR